MIDHRASPGTAEVPEGTLLETATMHCAHCNGITIRNPSRTRERASCLKCGGMYICDNCAIIAKQADYIHKPYQQLIQEIYKQVSNG